MDALNQADTAWLMVSCALVMLMTPGLALFYGGMVGSKNVLSSFMHSFIALGIITLAVGRHRLLARRSVRTWAAGSLAALSTPS